MACRSCHSTNVTNFTAEMNIHFPGMRGLDKPTVWVFPHILVCFKCGFTEFRLQHSELRRLADADSPEQRQQATA